jgi:RNA polymerase sigma factor (sigma-70 family)
VPDFASDNQTLRALDLQREKEICEDPFSETAWKTLYRRAYAFVRHRENAEDLAQETCLQLWNELKSGRRFEFLGAWLNTVLRNAMLGQIRKSRPGSCIPIQASSESVEEGNNVSGIDLADPSPSALEILIESDRAQEESRLLCKVVLVLKDLPENERECIIMTARGCSFVQIAKVLNVDYRTAIKMTRRAVAKIRSEAES